MKTEIKRRAFLQAAAGCALCFRARQAWPAMQGASFPGTDQPGMCPLQRPGREDLRRRSRKALWPTPKLDLNAEIERS